MKKIAILFYQILAKCTACENGNGGVPGGPRGLQIRSVPATVGVGGFDSHTFPLISSILHFPGIKYFLLIEFLFC